MDDRLRHVRIPADEHEARAAAVGPQAGNIAVRVD
jgi:hypothetical protein